ncbi:MAG: hypothetical protein ACKVJV_11080 [Gammaproteobacteria bacterium]|jgi:hypothetical protein
MRIRSLHVLFEKLTNLGVTLIVEGGKLEWETILPLPGSLLDELIARQAEFVSMINGAPINEDPICLMPRPPLGGDKISSNEVAGIIALLEEFGTTMHLSSTGVHSTSSKPLPPEVVELLHKYMDDIYEHLWTKEHNNRRRN